MDPSPFTHGVKRATMVRRNNHRHEAGGSDMNNSKTVVRLGIDSGKNSFHLWGVNAQDERVLKKPVRRRALLREVAKLPPCLIGMEARGEKRRKRGKRTPTLFDISPTPS